MSEKTKKRKKHLQKNNFHHGDFWSLESSPELHQLESEQSWREIAGQLVRSKRRRALVRLLGGGERSPISWLLSQNIRHEKAEKQISRWYQALQQPADSAAKHLKIGRLTRALDDAAGMPVGPELPLISLGCSHVINAVADSSVGYPEWAKIVEQLANLSRLSDFDVGSPDIKPWVIQILSVELPLSLAYQVPEFVSPDLARSAVRKMSNSVTEMLDNDGWPDANSLATFGPLVASWARALAIMRRFNLKFPPDAAIQVEWSVRQLLRLLRRDRSLMFAGLDAEPCTDECLQLVLKMSTDADDKTLVSRVLKGKSKKKPKRILPRESSISEWSESGILQSGWWPGAPKVVFEYTGRSFRLEIGAAKTLICGEAMPDVVFNGRPATPRGGFEVVCNEHDEDLDFVELQMNLSDNLTLNRQLILSRDEEFLMVADCVLPSQPGRIEYRCDWPLAGGIKGMPETETREVYLRTKKIQSLVLPLALPEWKIERGEGRLEMMGNLFRLTHSTEGAGLYCPLFFDLNPRRSKKKRTWRRLTVAENLKQVNPDVAAAFRVQLDEQQWFFYRVVSARGNRTFLGENYNGEFVFNRFDRDGKVTQIIGIE